MVPRFLALAALRAQARSSMPTTVQQASMPFLIQMPCICLVATGVLPLMRPILSLVLPVRPAPLAHRPGVFASRVLSASLPDYHLVNWHLSGDGGTGPFDAAYGCPPGMQLVGPGIGPQQHVIPTGWRKERAPTAI